MDLKTLKMVLIALAVFIIPCSGCGTAAAGRERDDTVQQTPAPTQTPSPAPAQTPSAASQESADSTESVASTGSTVSTESAASTEASAPPLNKKGALPEQFIFVYNGANIVMDEDAAQLFQDIGQPDKTFESPSCAFNGVDKLLYYKGFTVSTYPADDGKDRIKSITLKDPSVSTQEGLRLGMSLDDMESVYGKDYTNMLDLYSYVVGDVKVAFLFLDDKLADITYYNMPVTNLEQ